MTARRPAHTEPSAVCDCGRRYRLRKDGLIPRHSPIVGWRETPWCPHGETRPGVVGQIEFSEVVEMEPMLGDLTYNEWLAAGRPQIDTAPPPTSVERGWDEMQLPL